MLKGNVAYIDGANLYNGVKSLGWNFDYARFRVWLSDKYNVETAYLFLGFIPKNKELYESLRSCGYVLVFKDVIYDRTGRPKGNCDADLVVAVMKDVYENNCNNAILVSSDGDYTPLVLFLLSKEKLGVILSPYRAQRCSVLLKRTNARISYLSDHQTVLENEKAPDADETA